MCFRRGGDRAWFGVARRRVDDVVAQLRPLEGDGASRGGRWLNWAEWAGWLNE
jgi:hypothetical protein